LTYWFFDVETEGELTWFFSAMDREPNDRGRILFYLILFSSRLPHTYMTSWGVSVDKKGVDNTQTFLEQQKILSFLFVFFSIFGGLSGIWKTRTISLEQTPRIPSIFCALGEHAENALLTHFGDFSCAFVDVLMLEAHFLDFCERQTISTWRHISGISHLLATFGTFIVGARVTIKLY
jgi:hypothetical protein